MEQTEVNNEIIKKARKRVGFKIHFSIYFLTNLFLWILWYFLYYGQEEKFPLPWPSFISSAWGIVVIAHYLIVFKWNSKLVVKEYNKLMKDELKQKKTETIQTKENQD